MASAVGTTSKLVHSKRHGELVLDASTQSVQLIYPRVNRFFYRKFDQPRKCVVSRKLLQVISSNGKQRFMIDTSRSSRLQAFVSAARRHQSYSTCDVQH
uniref:Uncharacterized protein n=1 Tax=Hyaloperonospora arabidopsidis (strain Emoy2) TaxID=559515 RepID=M4BCV9_HYAAE